ncbi:MAG: molybdopterin cofactor-binding domain-containing protein, partial [Betaproteobacteria bacterium]
MSGGGSLQVQFDPSSARFGASRSQKRVEDDRLLTGKGLYSDDRRFAGEVWMVLVRSPHAHARVVSIDLSDALGAPGVLAAWSMQDLAQDGVGPIPFPPLFKRADGSPMAGPNGAQACEVEVDPDTGEVEVVSLASCDDIGRVINHAIVEGQ